MDKKKLGTSWEGLKLACAMQRWCRCCLNDNVEESPQSSDWPLGLIQPLTSPRNAGPLQSTPSFSPPSPLFLPSQDEPAFWRNKFVRGLTSRCVRRALRAAPSLRPLDLSPGR